MTQTNFTPEQTEEIQDLIREIEREGQNEAAATEWGCGSSNVAGAVQDLVDFVCPFGVDEETVRDLSRDVARAGSDREGAFNWGTTSGREVRECREAREAVLNFITTGERPE